MNLLSSFLTASLVLRLATATAFAQLKEVPAPVLPVGGALGAAASATSATNLQLPPSALGPSLAITPAADPTLAGSPTPLAGAAAEPAKAAPLAGPAPLAQSGPAAVSARAEAAVPAANKTAPASSKALARLALGGRSAEPGEPGGKPRIPSLDLSGQGRTLFDGGRELPAAPEASDAVSAHEKGFERYQRSIMGARVPDAKQTRALLEMYLEERNIGPASAVALELERRLLPARPQVSPAFKAYAPVLLKIWDEEGVPIARLEAMMREQRLLSFLAGPQDSEALERALTGMLLKERLAEATASYPDNAQGHALRSFADHVAVKSGKSVEELARAGAFAYADFRGRTVVRITSGRDPDVQSADVVFYGTRSGDAWKFGVYRQNRRSAAGHADAFYVQALKDWLVAGGIPATDLDF